MSTMWVCAMVIFDDRRPSEPFYLKRTRARGHYSAVTSLTKVYTRGIRMHAHVHNMWSGAIRADKPRGARKCLDTICNVIQLIFTVRCDVIWIARTQICLETACLRFPTLCTSGKTVLRLGRHGREVRNVYNIIRGVIYFVFTDMQYVGRFVVGYCSVRFSFYPSVHLVRAPKQRIM